MNIIFFGSPSYSCKVLESLLANKHVVQTVVTQNFKNNRRTKTPVGLLSESKNINTLYPADLSDKKFIETLKSYNADLYIVYAYGKILPPELISLPKCGVINIHCSLLPKWRGAAPIQRALEKGDLKTGVTFFKIDESLDTGAIIASYEYNIEENDHALLLEDKLTQIAVDHLEEVFLLNSNLSSFIQQNEFSASYAKKIHKAEAIINWNHDPYSICCKIKSLTGGPIAETELFGIKLKVWKAKQVLYAGKEEPGAIIKFNYDELCIVANNGAVSIEKLQLPGKNIISARDLFNSNSAFVRKIKQYLRK